MADLIQYHMETGIFQLLRQQLVISLAAVVLYFTHQTDRVSVASFFLYRKCTKK